MYLCVHGFAFVFVLFTFEWAAHGGGAETEPQMEKHLNWNCKVGDILGVPKKCHAK